MCTLACPFGVIFYNKAEGIVNNCELCHGDPECIKFCPTDCLTLVDDEVATMGKKKALSEKLMDSYREAKF
jgi:Fe-S-cluster-containing hydrogenase component 2